jgi:hypothetical protein
MSAGGASPVSKAGAGSLPSARAAATSPLRCMPSPSRDASGAAAVFASEADAGAAATFTSPVRSVLSADGSLSAGACPQCGAGVGGGARRPADPPSPMEQQLALRLNLVESYDAAARLAALKSSRKTLHDALLACDREINDLELGLELAV